MTRAQPAGAVDSVTVEIIRSGLVSAAEQMKRALVRTSFSTIIYEVLDFAVAICDHRYRMLAQAPSLPMFMGSLSFCVERAVAEAGGSETLEPGDVLLYNDPFGTGSHAQDVAVVMPIFLADRTLVGYSAIKAHWLDIGAKDPYCTDTVDVYQEGTVFPALRIYRGGRLDPDILRLVTVNSRTATQVAGDLQAQVNGCHVAAEQVRRLVDRHGLDTFRAGVEEMFDHGERVMRSYFAELPDGEYEGHGALDDDGLSPELIPFTATLRVEGDQVTVDLRDAPPAVPGPMNCPLATTLSACRVALTMLAGAGEAPTDGHFRALRVLTEPGTLFHPVRPSPSYLYGWSALQLIEVILDAIGRARPEAVPAWSGGCLAGGIFWGTRPGASESWVSGGPHVVGQGAHVAGDGASAVMHHSESATQLTSVEVSEVHTPWIVRQLALAPDSGGAGTFRGGLGVDIDYQFVEPSFATVTLERSKSPPTGLAGGLAGRPNLLVSVDGTAEAPMPQKATRHPLPAGTTLRYRTGGGGGWGPPAERDDARVADDLRLGYISEAYAERHHPGALRRLRG